MTTSTANKAAGAGSESAQVLDDILVVELGDETTQYCGQLLGDLGARVIKIEPPGGGACRRRGPFKDDKPDPNGSLYFWAFNTSKESVVLDLSKAADLRVLKRLLAKADVFLEGGAPGYAESLGLGYDELSATNPGLVMTCITPFGRTGPRAAWKGSDIVHWATGGILSGAGYGQPGEPLLGSHGDLSYIVGGHAGFVGTLLALTGRDLTGEGQLVDASIQEACSFINRGAVLEGGGDPNNPATDALAPIAPGSYSLRLGHVPCKNGKYMIPMTVMVGPDNWRQFAAWFKEKKLASALWSKWDEELAEMGNATRSMRSRTLSNFREALEEAGRQFTAEELCSAGQAMGFTWAPYNAPDELMEDEHLLARKFFREVHHPEHGRSYTYAGEPYKFSEAGWRINRRPPLLGEHGDQIRELAGKQSMRYSPS